jgi:hypothetical protein
MGGIDPLPHHETKAQAFMKITPVVLCGGSGTRLWPLSRTGFPKQFLVLSGSNSLFQQAVERVNGLGADDITLGETLVVTNRLAKPDTIPLEIIEVQSGSYLGEDDIVRFEDTYGRK